MEIIISIVFSYFSQSKLFHLFTLFKEFNLVQPDRVEYLQRCGKD